MARESTTKTPRKAAVKSTKPQPLKAKAGAKRKSRKEKPDVEDEEEEDIYSDYEESGAKENGKAKKRGKTVKEYDSDALDDDSDADAEPPKKRKRGQDMKPLAKVNTKATKRGKAVKEYDSDALDDASNVEPEPAPKKRKKTAISQGKTTSSPRKKSRRAKKDSDEEFDDAEDEQEVIGEIVQAPKTGRVPPGQISQNTLEFLGHMKDPKCNNREWVAEKEWKDFVEAFTDAIIEVDPEVPPLPPKDVIHRIYRDIRFSNDKTPYKQGFSASFSRSGRKGTFAGFKPGNQSIIAAGAWCPGKNELSTIRANIKRNPRRLREIISTPDFVEHFGEPKPQPEGERSNIFGMEDELKVAPKGVDKNHKDIDLLKCRSFAVVERFLDSEVLAPDFKERLAKVAAVMCPFVHCLNDMMSVMESESEGEEDGEE
ncbi:uncharacterized protein SCHCODRAFT_02628058 [Schizophyllum commune H4-8]|uniref:uncharacterized protein n=1 Tax=Schizophyllum commune (strain H4-8 / FGSC 9210) TaxID=578458 RepID=UPI0021608A0A|nr:uncharacterized protein SCHCODRAFT_02628058 [Schizophyllum commune H4-8]KAI5891075.1 hypothetical protein SCHCODRAFT_02628058 [Schizophyllum commune H4-8]